MKKNYMSVYTRVTRLDELELYRDARGRLYLCPAGKPPEECACIIGEDISQLKNYFGMVESCFTSTRSMEVQNLFNSQIEKRGIPFGLRAKEKMTVDQSLQVIAIIEACAVLAGIITDPEPPTLRQTERRAAPGTGN